MKVADRIERTETHKRQGEIEHRVQLLLNQGNIFTEKYLNNIFVRKIHLGVIMMFFISQKHPAPRYVILNCRFKIHPQVTFLVTLPLGILGRLVGRCVCSGKRNIS